MIEYKRRIRTACQCKKYFNYDILLPSVKQLTATGKLYSKDNFKLFEKNQCDFKLKTTIFSAIFSRDSNVCH